MGKIDLIDVLSGDVPTSHLRIEKALQRYHDSGAQFFVLNGFNSPLAHDEDFEGESWRDDERLVDIYRELEPLYPMIVYARNTIENGLRLRELVYGKDMNSETVTSKTHLPRLNKMYWHVFPDGEFDRLAFSSSTEPRGAYLARALLENVKLLRLPLLMNGIERGDWKIDEKYAERRYRDSQPSNQ